MDPKEFGQPFVGHTEGCPSLFPDTLEFKRIYDVEAIELCTCDHKQQIVKSIDRILAAEDLLTKFRPVSSGMADDEYMVMRDYIFNKVDTEY